MRDYDKELVESPEQTIARLRRELSVARDIIALTMLAIGAVERPAAPDMEAEALALRVILEVSKREGYDGKQPFASWVVSNARKAAGKL